ncbi:hypothetical protein [Streptomyces sp. NPDC047000]|uniref:hypothetical protein n=1 Tax=Streptomyces sp. NPDC047000 TaxID=3155474 RepID=UPI0033D7F31D
MGDRLSGDGVPDRRRAHPGGPVPGARRVTADGGLEALLAAAIRVDEVDPAAERRAVAAFGAARDAGALTARPRGRDDWRPRAARRGRRSLRVTLSVAAAGLTLGGVAYAGIGVAGSRSAEAHSGRDGAARHSAGARSTAAGVTPDAAAPSGSARAEHPKTAQDTEAHCRAYEQVKEHGKALDATAWRRLADAAGGTANVEAYCAARLAGAAGDKAAGNSGTAPAPAADANPRSTADGNANGGAGGNSGANGTNGTNGNSGANGSGGANGNAGQKATKAPAGQ